MKVKFTLHGVFISESAAKNSLNLKASKLYR